MNAEEQFARTGFLDNILYRCVFAVTQSVWHGALRALFAQSGAAQPQRLSTQFVWHRRMAARP